MKNHRTQSAAAISKKVKVLEEHQEKIKKDRDERDKRFEKNMEILANTDRREALKCSRLDQLARKQLASNVDYFLPDQLKSHVVKKFFEYYELEADKARELIKMEEQGSLKDQTAMLKAHMKSRAEMKKQIELELMEQKKENVADIPHLKFLVHLDDENCPNVTLPSKLILKKEDKEEESTKPFTYADKKNLTSQVNLSSTEVNKRDIRRNYGVCSGIKRKLVKPDHY
jgi:hypothetical protein